ncbi:MAG: glycoside hydrolase family 43 protein [Candidatus Symbiothrix sp.]|jgi:hypothetical protein|nr:glycoside hydrolase family 43 protein [Candidatus Symbiothrix sp.]
MSKLYFIVILLTLAIPAFANNFEEETDDPASYTIDINDFWCRDPYIFVDEATKSYYLHINEAPYFGCYKSKNLVKWKKVGYSFTRPSNFWGTKDFWAPDAFYFEGSYYVFATFSSDSQKRGVSVFKSNNAEGPFTPVVNASLTRSDWNCLDGTLYIDQFEDPWMIFCHEWIDTRDGEIHAARMSYDLSSLESATLLFKASSASYAGNDKVTDAPFIYEPEKGVMFCLWSTFNKSNQYVIGVAKSSNGTLFGTWTQQEPLNDDNGGHAMIFEGFDGVLRISYHAPNTDPHLTIKRIAYRNGSLRLVAGDISDNSSTGIGNIHPETTAVVFRNNQLQFSSDSEMCVQAYDLQGRLITKGQIGQDDNRLSVKTNSPLVIVKTTDNHGNTHSSKLIKSN